MKKSKCGKCGRRAAELCAECGRPVCLRCAAEVEGLLYCGQEEVVLPLFDSGECREVLFAFGEGPDESDVVVDWMLE